MNIGSEKISNQTDKSNPDSDYSFEVLKFQLRGWDLQIIHVLKKSKKIKNDNFVINLRATELLNCSDNAEYKFNEQHFFMIIYFLIEIL